MAKRLSVDLNEKADEQLSKLAEEENITKAEVVRKALALYNYVQESTRTAGTKLSLTSDSDEIVKDIVLH